MTASQDAGTSNGATDLKAVLIVEDDAHDFQLELRELKKLKLQNPVIHVSSVEELMQFMKGEASFADRQTNSLPAVVLLDMHLRAADGLDAAAWLRSQLKFRKIPIIAISG